MLPATVLTPKAQGPNNLLNAMIQNGDQRLADGRIGQCPTLTTLTWENPTVPMRPPLFFHKRGINRAFFPKHQDIVKTFMIKCKVYNCVQYARMKLCRMQNEYRWHNPWGGSTEHAAEH